VQIANAEDNINKWDVLYQDIMEIDNGSKFSSDHSNEGYYGDCTFQFN